MNEPDQILPPSTVYQNKDPSNSNSEEIDSPVKISVERLSRHTSRCEKQAGWKTGEQSAEKMDEGDDLDREELVEIDVVDENDKSERESCQCEPNQKIVLFGGTDSPKEEELQNQILGQFLELNQDMKQQRRSQVLSDGDQNEFIVGLREIDNLLDVDDGGENLANEIDALQ